MRVQGWQVRWPEPSSLHWPAQQSPSTVHRLPVDWQPWAQTRLPLSSGAHTPLQQLSPKAQDWPAGTQQRLLPDGPVAHCTPGNVSAQHSAVSLQDAPGRVQPGTPPTQRCGPCDVVTQPVSPPPGGQQFAPAPTKHSSPGS
jgi:hypothetical protein